MTMRFIFIFLSIGVAHVGFCQADKFSLIANGHDFFAKGKWQKALDSYKAAGCNVASSCPQIVYERMKIAKSKLILIVQEEQRRKDEQPESAESYYQKAIKETSNENKIYYFTKAIELNPTMEDAYFYRGKAYYGKSIPDYNAAFLDFEKAISIDPNDEGNLAWCGYAAYDNGDYGVAMKYLSSTKITSENLKLSAKKDIDLIKEKIVNSIKIDKIRVDFGVYDTNRKGMRIHIKFDITGFKGADCYIAAYFYYNDGTMLMDLENDNDNKANNGQVVTTKNFNPPYASSSYADFQLFLPVDQITFKYTGKYDLKFQIQFWNKDCGFIGTKSEFQNFTFTKNQFIP